MKMVILSKNGVPMSNNITLEKIRQHAIDNDACNTYLDVFTNAIINGNIKLAWQIVAIKIDWLTGTKFNIGLSDIPIDIDGECIIQWSKPSKTIYNILNKKIDGESKFFVYGKIDNVMNHKDGNLHGIYTSYHSNGNIYTQCNYENDMLEGMHNVYHTNGSLSKTMFYLHDIPVGELKTYHDNGQLSTIGNFVDGNRVGEWIDYNEFGKINRKTVYKHGLYYDVDYYYYNDDGKLIKQNVGGVTTVF